MLLSLLDFVFQIAFNGGKFSPEVDVSENYKHWISQIDWRRCVECKNLHGKIWRLDEEPDSEPPIHPNCRCVIEPMESIKAGTATMNGTDGADWTLKYEGELPDYYIAIEDIYDLGWQKGKKPTDYAPGKMITGGIYQNRNGHLPQKEGRIWFEADINYEQGSRNSQRAVWSDDGLIFVTYDHYATFHEII
jgi:ribonuclease